MSADRVTIRIALHRPSDGTGDIWAYAPAENYTVLPVAVGRAVRVEPGPGRSRGWRAELWRDHPSKLPAGEPTAERHRDLAEYLTNQVAVHGEWWS